MVYPEWVMSPEISADEQRKRKVAYHIRLAALHHNADGSVGHLADGLGVSRQSLYVAMWRGHISAPLAIALETVAGAKILPRSLLCPEKFSETAQ